MSRNLFFSVLIFTAAAPLFGAAELKTGWSYFYSPVEPGYREAVSSSFIDVKSIRELKDFKPEKGFVVLRNRFTALPESGTWKAIAPGRMMWSEKVWLNGRYLGMTGRFPPLAVNVYNWDRLYPFPSEYLKTENELIFVVYFDTEGGFKDVPLFGGLEELRSTVQWRRFLHGYINLIFFCLLIGFLPYHLLLFYRTREKYHLYFGLTSLFYSLYSINTFIWFLPRLPMIDYTAWNWFSLSCVFFSLFFIFHFLRSIFNVQISSSLKIFLLLLTVMPSVILLFSSDYGSFFFLRRNILILVPCFILLMFWLITRRRSLVSDYFMPILVGFMPGFIFGLYDALQMILNRTDGIFLSGFAIPFILGAVSFNLAGRLAKIGASLEALNQTLQLRVRDRTQAVQKWLARLIEMKTRQDADYRLISEMLKPFQQSVPVAPGYEFRSFARQLRTFSHQGHSFQIGGDLIQSGSILAARKNCIVFLVLDAMGTSLQGAAGAIALGAVFKAILADQTPAATPRDWITEVAAKLENFCMSFEGGMLASAFLGCLEPETGELHHYSADFPPPVLVRGGEARFLDTINAGRLGVARDNPVMVRDFSLKTGDRLVITTDGRFHFTWKMGPLTGIMNNDDSVFPETVLALRPERLPEDLLRRVELSDDIAIFEIQRLG